MGKSVYLLQARSFGRQEGKKSVCSLTSETCEKSSDSFSKTCGCLFSLETSYLAYQKTHSFNDYTTSTSLTELISQTSDRQTSTYTDCFISTRMFFHIFMSMSGSLFFSKGLFVFLFAVRLRMVRRCIRSDSSSSSVSIF